MSSQMTQSVRGALQKFFPRGCRFFTSWFNQLPVLCTKYEEVWSTTSYCGPESDCRKQRKYYFCERRSTACEKTSATTFNFVRVCCRERQIFWTWDNTAS